MDFSGAQAKISWANKQLKALDTHMECFFSGYAYAIGSKYDAEASEIVLYPIGYEAAPVTEWGLRMGDCLHNLRAALDHTTWQFALAHLQREPTEDEAKRIQFPIENTRGKFRDARVKPLISTDHFDWIDNFQPYHDGADAARNKLAVLSRLDNIDKHRVIHAAALVPEGFEMTFGETRDIESYGSLEIYFGEPLEKDAPVGRIRDVVPNGPSPYVEAEGPTEFSVVLSYPADPALHKAPVIPLLAQLGEIVDAVVSTAEATFT